MIPRENLDFSEPQKRYFKRSGKAALKGKTDEARVLQYAKL